MIKSDFDVDQFCDGNTTGLTDQINGNGKMSSGIMRECMVKACASKLAFCARDFEESLFALHQEVDNLGTDNDANQKQ